MCKPSFYLLGIGNRQARRIRQARMPPQTVISDPVM